MSRSTNPLRLAPLLLCLAGSAVAAEPAAPAPASTPAAASASDSDVLLDALSEWSQTSMTMAVPGVPSPYRTVFATTDVDSYFAQASFGALVEEDGHPSRPTRVEVVMGDPSLDSARFSVKGLPPDSIARANLVVEDVPLALSRDLWITSDHAFKLSVARLGMKAASLAAEGGEPPPPDWSAAAAVQAVDLSPAPPIPRDDLRRYAVDASARLRQIEGLRVGTVNVRQVSGHYHLATSEGTRLIQPYSYAVVYAWTDSLREDGVQVYDYRQWVATSGADLPPLEQVAAEVEAMGRSVSARVQAPVVDFYEGPVLFEGRAAADLFRYLMSPELCGTPPIPTHGRSFQESMRDGPRIGRRLLPQGWSVQDDPGAAPEGLAGGFTYDMEGVPAQPVSLVEDGYVRDLLMTRIPRQDLQQSNGHARGAVQRDWDARLSITTVQPDKDQSSKRIKRHVTRALAASGSERMLVVRGLERGREGSLPRPTDAVWRYPDGHEEPVLSLAFQNVDRRSLRDIVAAGGGQQTHPYLAPWSADSKAGTDTGLPTVLIAPQQILLEELEAVFPGPDEKPHGYAWPEL